MALDQSWYVGPSIGGPIAPDRLWFYTTYSFRRASQFPAGLFDTVDTSSLRYVPDLSNPTIDRQNLWGRHAAAHVAGVVEGQGAGVLGQQQHGAHSSADRRTARPDLHRVGGGQRGRQQRQHVPAHLDPAADQPDPVRVRRVAPAGQQRAEPARRRHADRAWHRPRASQRAHRPAQRLRGDDADDAPQHGLFLQRHRRAFLDAQQRVPRVDVVRHRLAQPQVRVHHQPQAADRDLP